MKFVNILVHILNAVFLPIRRNAKFFCFMYVLGIVAAWAVLPENNKDKFPESTYYELFIELYLVCALLSVIPHKIRQWVRFVCAAVVYAVTITDVFCFVKFQTTINPTILLLMGETNSREAGEFFKSYLGADVLFSSVGQVLLLILAHFLATVIPPLTRRISREKTDKVKEKLRLNSAPMTKIAGYWKSYHRYVTAAAGAFVVWFLVYSLDFTADNRRAMAEMFSKANVGQVEHELTKKDCAKFYLPTHRLAFSLFSNSLAAQQINKLIVVKDNVSVDSCSFRSPHIVLIIGESYNKYHSQLYGYDKPTAPMQVKRSKRGRLVPYTDVVAPWNLTSFVFKNMFSTYVRGMKGEWCDYPLFPEIFRKAGYHVTFITNQFLPKAKEAVYDFSGGFFLNNEDLSKAQFDTRNTTLHKFDDGVLTDYDELKKYNKEHNLTIFHLMGQHVSYNTRYPKTHRKYYGDDYDRPDLTARNRDILSHYDNATIYNDSIVDCILNKFEDEEAIVVYLSDHGEECFNDGFQHYGRNHSAEITPRLAHQEFDVPLWIWCSHKYAVKHPDIFSEVVGAKDRRMMTDALPHLLLYLAGISSKDYHEEYNILSPRYDEMRPRVIKGKVDYDKLMEAENGK